MTPSKHFFAAICLLLTMGYAAHAQTFKTIQLSELSKMMSAPSDKIQVINFWATWCAPCVKELPLFEAAHQRRTDAQIHLVSLDEDLNPELDKVKSFLKKRPLQSNVYALMAAGSPNDWIDTIEPKWSGAIPATLFINTKTGERKFVEGEVSQGDIDKWINSLK